MGGTRQARLAPHRELVLALVAARPDQTLEELRAALAARGVRVGYGSAWRFLRAERITFKKTALAAEQTRPDVARARALWMRERPGLDPTRLVFIDETWAKTNMARTHGRCIRGTRLKACVPHGHWKTTTFLAALRCDRIDAPMVLDGPINGRSFLAYAERVLAPTLRPGDVVILDNLGSHKSAAVRRAIEARGARACASCRPIRRT